MTLPAGMHSDGGGLYLRVKPGGSRSWVFICQWQGKRREIGLGSILSVDVDFARDRAEEARARLAQGLDPAAAVEDEDPPARVTFGQAADALVDSLEGGWRNPKHRAQWRSTLKIHCKPIWSKPVDEIDTTDVLAVLRPIWTETPETASRVRGRIERVLDAAKVKGQRSGENPARWRGHLDVILPGRKKRGSVKHHAAMPYQDVPEFVQSLKGRLSTAARALHLLILTVGRTSEILSAKWQEIDRTAKVWTVPADRMKAGVEHRVPLTPAALAVLDAVAIHGTDPDAYVFPSQKVGAPLSDMSMLMLLKRMKIVDVTPHGMRSAFRDWVGEETRHPREVAEAALAHQVGNAVERSYRRGDALAKRRGMMNEWADFIEGHCRVLEVAA